MSYLILLFVIIIVTIMISIKLSKKIAKLIHNYNFWILLLILLLFSYILKIGIENDHLNEEYN